MSDTNKLGAFITEEGFDELTTKAISNHLEDLNKYGEETGEGRLNAMTTMMIMAAGTGVCRELAKLIFNKEEE